MAISLGICEFLRNYIPECKIKWPNDILIRGKKVVGVLTELSAELDTQVKAVNYAVPPDVDQPRPPQPAAKAKH